MVKIFSALILISGITLIVSVLFQESKSEGLGAISGGTEGRFGMSRVRTLEAMLAKITTISAIVFMISALVIAAIQ
ncbi:MAG: preprotein translocase subunit SecG [Tissierellia bacterium]|nr:preprotein translocase subunit SecG [Tissierellia bacterium]